MRRALAFALALVFAACSGSTGTNRPVDTPTPPTGPGYPGYETFDPSGYDAPPPRPAQTVEHDVPARLMAGRVEVPGGLGDERTVDGFRIQIFSGEDRRVADEVRARADAWAREVRGQDSAPANPETDVVYLQPYYRVRLGAFEYRAEAETALPLVRQRFPEAFIVPDRVTLRD